MFETKIVITLWVLIRTAILLGLGYLLLRLLTSLAKGLAWNDARKQRLINALHGLSALYVPIAIIIVVVAAVLWQQRLIGIPALLCLILFYRPLSLFFLGRVVRAKNDIAEGNTIQVGNIEGRIVRWGSTEVKMSTSEGIVSIPYSTLYSEGYTLMTDTQSSRRISITVIATERARPQLRDIIATSPYVRYDATVSSTTDESGHETLRFVPRTEDYIEDIKDLIATSGYEVAQA